MALPSRLGGRPSSLPSRRCRTPRRDVRRGCGSSASKKCPSRSWRGPGKLRVLPPHSVIFVTWELTIPTQFFYPRHLHIRLLKGGLAVYLGLFKYYYIVPYRSGSISPDARPYQLTCLYPIFPSRSSYTTYGTRSSAGDRLGQLTPQASARRDGHSLTCRCHLCRLSDTAFINDV